MTYEADGARLAEFTFKFSSLRDSLPYFGNTITFPEKVGEIILTHEHLGIRKSVLKESVKLGRERFQQLSPPKKKNLLNIELKNRIELFIKTFLKMESDNEWSLAKWAKVEWTADALDGNAPFIDPIYTHPAFEGRSFKWLLAELAGIETGLARKSATIALKGANELFELLTSVSPETSPEQIEQVLKKVQAHIFTDFGLKPWKPDMTF